MSKQEEEVARQNDALRRAWSQLLDTEAGRHIMADIIRACGVYVPSATSNAQVYWQEGRRALGLEFMSAYLSPEHHIELIRECALRDEQLRHARAKDERDDE